MGEKPQFNLGIVSAEIAPTSLLRSEAAADRVAFFGSDRNILEVRVLARKSSCGCDRLIECAVDAAGCGIDLRRKRFDIGRSEFFKSPVIENFLDDGMFIGQLFQNVCSG